MGSAVVGVRGWRLLVVDGQAAEAVEERLGEMISENHCYGR